MAKRRYALAAGHPSTYRRTVPIKGKKDGRQLVFEPGPGKAGVPQELTAEEVAGIARELEIGRIVEVDANGKPIQAAAPAAEPEPVPDAKPSRSSAVE